MTENSVIKHYKKQLIYRQHDLPDQNDEKKDAQHAKQTDEDNRIYDFVEPDAKFDYKTIDRNIRNNGKKTRKKRKNRNCRGQFRHEGMELIKLGTNTSHSLCKTKEPYNARIDKEKPQPVANSNKDEQKVPTYPKKAESLKETNDKSVIQNSFVDKTIILENSAPQPSMFGHALPQMVPERRNSREMNPKATTVQYRSPPHVPVPQSEYRVPIHPTPYIPPYPHPLQQNLPFGPYPRVHSPHLPPPPPYPLSRTPPRPVPRSPIRPIPQTPHHFQKSPVNPPYSGINFPFTRQSQHSNGYPLQSEPPIANQNPGRPIPRLPREYCERKKRKHLPEEEHHQKIKATPPVVAAIDLTVDQNPHEKHHKCHCECGKTYSSDPVPQEVIITVAGDKDNLQVPTYFRGKMVNGVLKLETDPNSKDLKSKPPQSSIQQNGTSKRHHEVVEMTKPYPPQITNVSDKQKAEGKLPPLFLIKDLLAKGVRVEKKPSHHNRILEESHKPSSLLSKTDNPKKVEKTNGTDNFRPVPIIRTEPNRVIVSTGHSRLLEEPTVRRKSQDHSVSNIMATNNRRQSVDIDTISISSSSSESVRSPRPKSDSVEKQIPRGKLFYYKTNNSFIRYFDDSQKKLFMNNLIADGSEAEIKHALSDDTNEMIELPRNTMFNSKDSLTVEEYVSEMTLAEKYIPKDFFLFYKFVTGYQICNNNLPVSFLTFLKIYNTNGLKVLYERYVSSLKQAG